MAFRIRSSDSDDIPALKNCWHTVFGDSLSDIDEFFERFYTPDAAIIAEVSGELAASGYLIPLGSAVLPDGSSVPCRVTYALSTLLEYRGLGCAAAITREAIHRCTGSSLSLICPAEDSLFDYYSQKAGYLDFFYAQLTEFSSSATGFPRLSGSVSALDVRNYAQLREALLQGRFHLRFSDNALEYQRLLCGKTGGFYSVTIGNRLYGAAVEHSGDGPLLIKELLTPEGGAATSAMALLCDFFRAERCLARSPAADLGTTGSSRFAMLIPDEAVCPIFTRTHEAAGHSSLLSPPPWFGFSFD